ncbi:hypothetical protein [Halomonas sp. HAL1]|uniref:hypothetical protein n=1 Tax=Halomonas sp. HAL1 TaxID=550984 RepID=UPI001112A18A|nr:hypothetical protein [Halomonas sp. HAL1]WKV92788.1 hypothetical protein Q3Y66_18390 [Halomonas sp. HAL1]
MIEDDEDFKTFKETLYEEIRGRVLSDFLADRASNLSEEIEEDIRPAIRENVFIEERENVLKSEKMVNFVLERFFDNPSIYPAIDIAKVAYHDHMINFLMNDDEYLMELHEEIKKELLHKQYKDEVRKYLLPAV